MKSVINAIYLLVDDSHSMTNHIMANLLALGVPMRNIYSATNGAEALTVLKKTKIDLVISDFNMPVMNGLELFKNIRADSVLSTTKFMMLTGETEAQLLKECIANGIDSLLLKPFNQEKFKKRVELTLSRIRA